MKLEQFKNNQKRNKRKLLIFIISIMTVASGYAQFFVEGGLGIGYYEDKSPKVDKLEVEPTTRLSVGFSPKVGYLFSDRMAAGASVLYSNYHVNEKSPDQNYQKRKTYNSEMGISVFSRYQLFRMNKFAVVAEGSMGGSKEQRKLNDDSNILYNYSLMTFSINVSPLLMYDLTDKYSLVTSCDFASLNLSTSTSKDEQTGDKSKTNNFGFGTGSTLISSLGNIRIGFIYKFKQK